MKITKAQDTVALSQHEVNEAIALYIAQKLGRQLDYIFHADVTTLREIGNLTEHKALTLNITLKDPK